MVKLKSNEPSIRPIFLVSLILLVTLIICTLSLNIILELLYQISDFNVFSPVFCNFVSISIIICSVILIIVFLMLTLKYIYYEEELILTYIFASIASIIIIIINLSIIMSRYIAFEIINFILICIRRIT